jgi:hypothetical protein
MTQEAQPAWRVSPRLIHSATRLKTQVFEALLDHRLRTDGARMVEQPACA